jgi:hypothetical protein
MARPRPASSTAWKIAFLVVATGGVSATVLSLRAQRLAHAHVATGALDEARELERTIDRARIDIARLSSPERVRGLIAERETPMRPLLTKSRRGR